MQRCSKDILEQRVGDLAAVHRVPASETVEINGESGTNRTAEWTSIVFNQLLHR